MTNRSLKLTRYGRRCRPGRRQSCTTASALTRVPRWSAQRKASWPGSAELELCIFGRSLITLPPTTQQTEPHT
jgi:hypothetical protein